MVLVDGFWYVLRVVLANYWRRVHERRRGERRAPSHHN
jgi:hypothetical protein